MICWIPLFGICLCGVLLSIMIMMMMIIVNNINDGEIKHSQLGSQSIDLPTTIHPS